MWENVTGTVVSGAVLALIAHLITRGGRRWRGLSVARHELEVAQLLVDDADRAEALRAKAGLRIDRYLKPKPLESEANKVGLWAGAVASVIVFGLIVALLYAVGPDLLPVWAQGSIGFGGAVLWHLLAAGLQSPIRRMRSAGSSGA